MVHERTKWRFRDDGSEKVYADARDVGALIRGVESDRASHEWAQYQSDNITSLLFALGNENAHYKIAKRAKETGKVPTFGAFDLPILFEDPDVIITRYEADMKRLEEGLDGLVERELQRESHFASRIAEYADRDLFGYFGYMHRTTSHLLARNGIIIPGEALGDVTLNPEEKLSLLMKYEKLGLNPQELRDDDPARDANASKKSLYLELSPQWSFFQDLNGKRFSQEELVRYFWNNLDKITRLGINF